MVLFLLLWLSLHPKLSAPPSASVWTEHHPMEEETEKERVHKTGFTCSYIQAYCIVYKTTTDSFPVKHGTKLTSSTSLDCFLGALRGFFLPPAHTELDYNSVDVLKYWKIPRCYGNFHCDTHITTKFLTLHHYRRCLVYYFKPLNNNGPFLSIWPLTILLLMCFHLHQGPWEIIWKDNRD